MFHTHTSGPLPQDLADVSRDPFHPGPDASLLLIMVLQPSSIIPLTNVVFVAWRDPATDDPELLRTVIQLLRISALTTSNREDRDGIHTADEKITEALGMLGKIDEIKKIAGTLRLNAGKIEQQSDDVRTALARILSQAQAALSVAADATHNAA